MTAAPAAPLRRLVPLTLLVLLLHGALLQVRTDDVLLPGQEPLRTFSTRTLLAPPAPVVAAASPAAPAAAPRAQPRPAVPRARVPRAAQAPVEAAAPEPEEAVKMPTDMDSGGPALRPAAVAAPPAPASAVPGLPQVVSLPVPARMRYEVTAQRYGITLRGDAEMNWRHDGSTYEVQLEVRSGIGSRTQRSTGRITEEGLAPDYFWEKTRNEQATHFERERGRVTFSNNRPAAPLVAGIQDRLSVVVQLSVLVAGDPTRFPAGTQIAIPTAGTRDAETWIFSVQGEEDLELPGGTVRALKLERKARKEYDTSVELWLAPRMDYAPVRIRLTNPGGDTVDQRWSSTDKG